MSPTQWITATNAIGLVSQAGRYGGTYAISDIAFKFANRVSVEFELYLVKEFQRLKRLNQIAIRQMSILEEVENQTRSVLSETEKRVCLSPEKSVLEEVKATVGCCRLGTRGFCGSGQ